MVGAIVAMTRDRVIGLNGNLPWYYPADFKRFKEVTMGSVLVVGRKTWQSMGGKTLPGRDFVVISSHFQPGVPTFPTLQEALSSIGSHRDVWIAGGAAVYKASFDADVVEEVDLTLVPRIEIATTDVITYLPLVPDKFQPVLGFENPEDPRLYHQKYVRQ
jgi:dihydrofolate reductase